MNTTTITNRRHFITRSRSGHYTLTVREYGTWEMDGKTFPLDRLVARHEKLASLPVARHLAKQYEPAAA